MAEALDLDAVVFGGGAAGLWTLDELVRAGLRCMLLEGRELGSGQTVVSQGIIHGGVKYTLSGLFSPSARAIAEMPVIWRKCLAGEAEPDLTGTRLRSHFCHLWQTGSLMSKLGMFGARTGLRVRPRTLEAHERPAILRDCPGVVARLDEQVIEPWSFITVLSEKHRGRVLKIDVESGLEFERGSQKSGVRGQPSPTSAVGSTTIRLINPDTGDPLDLRAKHIVLAAGAGNASLRQMLGLSPSVMQTRPLHMTMLRGNLPVLNGHCVDGAATRVTITSTRDFGDRAIWHVGGQVAERGVAMDERTLIAHVREELLAVLPGLDLKGVQWATYRADRAEASSGGARPSDATVLCDGNVITAWPTKMALAPRLAIMVREMIADASGDDRSAQTSAQAVPSALRDWPRPMVALPPWETTHTWITLD
jgi:hypothetical protein